MNVRIKKMTLENFKGIKNLEIDFDGQNAIIYGDNATGKTSLFDAFLWLLFGKDSSDRSDFGVKPYDENGQEIHNLETVVEAELEIDGLKIATLKHMLKENWVKKNGQSEQVFSGNQHKYWINGISHSAGDYEKFVAGIAPKKIFPLITNPMAFNALKWQDRRDVLLKLCPVDIDSILFTRPEYAGIAEEIAQRGTDIYGLKKLKREQKSRDDKEIEQIPVRIAELQRLMDPDMERKYQEALEQQEALEAALDALSSSTDDGSSAIAAMKAISSEVMQLEAQLQNTLIKLSSERMNTRLQLSQELSSLRGSYRLLMQSSTENEKKYSEAEAFVVSLEATVAELRNKWYEVAEEQFVEPEVEDTCPHCGQLMPEGMRDAAIEKARKAFEARKEQNLERLTEEGVAANERIAQTKERMRTIQSSIVRINTDVDRVNGQIETTEAELRLYEGEPDFSQNPLILQLREALEAKKADLEDAKNAIDPSVDAAAYRKKQISQQLQDVKAVISAKQQQDSIARRIGELELRQKELGIQIAATEQELIRIDTFVTERCKALEESINALFPTVQWKLFDVQINAGIKDTCVCMIGGVPFLDANNAAKINAGLEIIDVLSRFYGASVPVFVDNAESVNDLRRIEGQRIALTVSHDPTLKVEIQLNERKVA